MTSNFANKPWLDNKEWAAREIVCASHVGTPVLLLAYLFSLVPGCAILWYGEGSMQGLIVAVLFLTCAGFVTYWWLRGFLYGSSVCRLLTLPGVIGGWFKADIECGLPGDFSRPVIVKLRNRGSRNSIEDDGVLWEMEWIVAADKVTPIGPGRYIVHVRLQVPRDPAQLPIPLERTLFGNNVTWILSVKKAARGIDFYAFFLVPIFDIRDAGESEQLAEQVKS